MTHRRSESKSSPRRLEAEQRRQTALGMRKGGATYAVIAEALGYANESGARKAVNEALARMVAETNETAEEVRQLELERLDAMLDAMWAAVTAKTHVVGMTDDGPIEAPGPDTRQVQAALKLMERRSKLLGLDVPQRVEHSGPGGNPIELAAEQAAGVRQILGDAEARDHLLGALEVLSGKPDAGRA